MTIKGTTVQHYTDDVTCIPKGCLVAKSLTSRLSTIARAFSRDLHDGKPNCRVE